MTSTEFSRQVRTLLPPDHPWQDRIHCFDCVDSTNTLAKAMAAQGAPHGALVIAGQQTGGRGRMGRSFLSPAGSGVYLSLILRPACGPDRLMHLTCAAAVAMCRAVEQVCGITPGIKWINDLICGGRKVAGILTELSLVPGTGRVDWAVVGIGINCRQRPEDFPPELRSIAGSLAMASGSPVSTAAMAAAMITALEQTDRVLLTEKAAIMDRYRSLCLTTGHPVVLHRGSQAEEGFALDIDDDGALLVKFPDGRVCPVSSGEASVRGTEGYLP